MSDYLCPSCSGNGLYYAMSWCASCGWHKPNQTLAHENFARDSACRWCALTG